MLAATLGAFAASYLFVPPLHSLSIASAEDLVGLLSYTFVAFTGSLLIDGQRRARQSALRSAAVAQDRLEQLERETLERSAAQHKLEQTQQQFALFMRHLPGAAWIKDVQGRYMYANETAERIFCRTLAELHNKTDDEIFPLETAREFKANDQIALQSGQRHQAVETLKQEDGLHFSIVNKFPIFGADGSPVMVGGMAFDITDRLKAEEELKKSQHQLSTILESISDGFVALDRQWRFTYVNREAAKLARKSPAEMVGRNIWEMIPEAVSSRFHAEMQRAMRDRVSVSFEDSNPYFQQCFRIHAYPSEEGLAVFVEEITAQKQAEAAEAELAAIVESSDDAIFGQTLDGIVTSWNPAAERLYGYTAAEMIGRPVSILIPPERQAEIEATMERVRSGQSAEQFETVRSRKDGGQVEVWLTLSPIARPDGGISGASAIARDIAQRKKLEQNLRQVQRLESLGVLAGGIAHDFNNLLTSVMGNAGLASCEIDPASPVTQRLKEIVLASERMADLTRQMLAYAGKGKFLLEQLDCSEKVAEISGLVRASVPKNVELQLQLEPNLPFIQADPGQLHQLIINLITNAAEAIGEGNGTVAVRTKLVRVDEEYLRTAPLVLDRTAPGDYVRVEVEDNGCGMADDMKARIFDPFFSTKVNGRGLGLSAALGIVRGHGGTLELRSAPGAGSRFRVLLPVAKDQATRSIPATGSGDLSGRGRILVVDDDEAIRNVVRAGLERYGYKVVAAEDGKEALRLIGLYSGEIALVLLDMTMPVMGGAETLEKLKYLAPGLPVLASSGYSEMEAMRHFGQDGVAGFIQKPYTPAVLARAVKAVLSRKVRAAT